MALQVKHGKVEKQKQQDGDRFFLRRNSRQKNQKKWKNKNNKTETGFFYVGIVDRKTKMELEPPPL